MGSERGQKRVKRGGNGGRCDWWIGEYLAQALWMSVFAVYLLVMVFKDRSVWLFSFQTSVLSISVPFFFPSRYLMRIFLNFF